MSTQQTEIYTSHSSLWKKTFKLFIVIGLLLVGVLCVTYVIDKNNKDLRNELEDIVNQFESRIKTNFMSNRFVRSIRKGRSVNLIEQNREAEEPKIDTGVVYYRWGRKDCSGPNNKLIYHGIGAGGSSSYSGGASNALCLQSNISYADGHFEDGAQGGSRIYGMEFADNSWIDEFFDLSLIQEHKLQYQSAACAACLALSRFAKIMIPGQATCPQGWTKEYSGYIMSGHYSNNGHANEAICVDETPQVVPGTSGSNGGELLYLSEIYCGSLPCEPYVSGRELRCVVCTI